MHSLAFFLFQFLEAPDNPEDVSFLNGFRIGKELSIQTLSTKHIQSIPFLRKEVEILFVYSCYIYQ